MKDVHENKLFYRNLQLLYGILFVCALEIFPPLNDLLQLTALPTENVLGGSGHTSTQQGYNGGLLLFLESWSWIFSLDWIAQILSFQVFVALTMVLDTVLSFTLERMVRRVYSKRSSVTKMTIK
jgi:hypothetical protein